MQAINPKSTIADMTERPSTFWLIPARGGSKGIPHKNLKPFCGVSLTGRAVDQALVCAQENDVVFVSTDSEEISLEGKKHGAIVPFLRPQELASDTASTYSVILHALEEFRKMGREFKRLVLLQPTSPLRSIDDITGCIKLWTPDIDMVVSVCESSANPYYNLFEENPEGYLKICKGSGEYTRRQDAPKVWEYNGAVYVITVSSVLTCKIGDFTKVVPFIMPSSRSIDLDTPEDWDRAERCYLSALF